jgi:mRNA interferase MazF
VSGSGLDVGRPRHAFIVREGRFDSTNSITLCVYGGPTEAPLLRMLIEPTDCNRLSSASRLKVDKVTTVPKARLGKRIGKLNDEDVVRLNRALNLFLGLARQPTPIPKMQLFYWRARTDYSARVAPHPFGVALRAINSAEGGRVVEPARYLSGVRFGASNRL